MMRRNLFARKYGRRFWLWLALAGICSAAAAFAQETPKQQDLLARTNERMSAFLDQFSNVKCTEQVKQEKLGKDNKVERKEESTYDYLVILTNVGGELNLSESRLQVQEAKRDKKNTPMLLSNGFATLFLVFHPLYSEAFKFNLEGEEMMGSRLLDKITFRHIPGMKTPAALALRGREYPLELSGTAWIDPQTGAIAKIDAGIEDTLRDVGLKSLHSEIEFAPVLLPDLKDATWFPVLATVEVETPRQHWRNTHRFTEYKKFSVSTDERVAQK